MRGFIILCLVAATVADLSGYSYNRASAPASTSSGGSFNLAAPIHQYQQAQQQAPQQHQQHQQQQQQHQHQQQQPQPQQEVSKEFYTYTAPEEEFSDPQSEQQAAAVNKKNLQVIFIHAPQQNGLNRAVQNFAQQTQEQQTAIYVLTKQADLSQLTNSLQREQNQVAHKPEVHFIKYRTPEDAARAQQSIRAQYDSLGGTSSNSDEGVAPVLNFASQQQSQGGHGAQAGHVGSPSQSYLPIRF